MQASEQAEAMAQIERATELAIVCCRAWRKPQNAVSLQERNPCTQLTHLHYPVNGLVLLTHERSAKAGLFVC